MKSMKFDLIKGEVIQTFNEEIKLNNNFLLFLHEEWLKIVSTDVLTFRPSWIVRKLNGNYNFNIIVNHNRVKQKRKALPFTKVNEKYDPEAFNFNRIKPEEIIAELYFNELFDTPYILKIIVNIAPIINEHFLIIPQPMDCLNQKVDFKSLYAVLVVISMRHFKGMVGFSSVGASASVNHLHYQLFNQFSLELIIKKWLDASSNNRVNDMYYVTEYIVPFFWMTIQDISDLKQIEAILYLTDYLTKQGFAYNIIMYRGIEGVEGSNDNSIYLILFPRKAIFDSPATIDSSFIGLSGIGVYDSFEITEEQIINNFRNIALNSIEFGKLINQLAEFYSKP